MRTSNTGSLPSNNRVSLDQHFLVDHTVAELMGKYASISKDDTILEVGSGQGALTKLLAESAGLVHSVEKDRRLIEKFKEAVVYDNVRVIEGDILKVALPDFTKVVSSPPYSISTPLLFMLFDHRFSLGVFLFQSDFADRLTATPGSSRYGRLAATAQYFFCIKLLDTVPPEAFSPPPEVMSRIVRLYPQKQFQALNERFYIDLVRKLFSQRRKMIKNSLKSHAIENIPKDILRKRPQELSLNEMVMLSNCLCP